jgi:hypothetical protein
MMCATFAQTAPDEAATLDRIRRSFFSALERDGGPSLQFAFAAVAILLLYVLVRWVRSESRRERSEQRALDARHATAMAASCASGDRRQWARVPAHLHVSCAHEDGRPIERQCETLNLGGGGVAFFARSAAALGSRVHLELELGMKRRLDLEGTIVRSEPAALDGALHVIAVKLGPITPIDREHIMRWIAHEERREIAASRRGRLCAECGRPMADEDTGDMHPACATAIRIHDIAVPG